MPLNTKIPQQVVQSSTKALAVKRYEAGMLVADMTKGALVLMDGATYGGIPLAREDVQIRAGSNAIKVNGKEWSNLLGTISLDIDPAGLVESAVSPSDKVLTVGADGKISAELSVDYDEENGLFALKGKDGEVISSFTLVIPTGITPKSVALVENPESQSPGLYLEFTFVDDDDLEIKLYANMDVLKDVYTAGRGITISDDRVISVDEDAISGVIADDLVGEGGGLTVVDNKLHLDAHASETPEYGLGDEDHYGHVRLADSGDGRATVQAGIAATPAAVQDVDDRAVHKEGDETISGVKTFTETPKVTLPDGGTDDVATITDVQAAVDGTVWSKRVDEIPEDTDTITADMPVGGLVITPDEAPGENPIPVLQMAIHQVVKQGDQKVLVEVPVGNGGGEVWGVYVPGTVPEDPSSIIEDMPVGSYVTDDKPTAPKTVPAPYNKEVWITESGTWTAPVTGWYEVLLIGGGFGGYVRYLTTLGLEEVGGGPSGGYKLALVELSAGDTIDVTIGAAGSGMDLTSSDDAPRAGGDTAFGALSSSSGSRLLPAVPAYTIASSWHTYAGAAGSGFGGGSINNKNGTFYGAGGGALINSQMSEVSGAGNGKQGAIRLRYYDPNKENN